MRPGLEAIEDAGCSFLTTLGSPVTGSKSWTTAFSTALEMGASTLVVTGCMESGTVGATAERSPTTLSLMPSPTSSSSSPPAYRSVSRVKR